MKLVRLSRGVVLPKRARSEAEEAFARAWGERLPAFVREHRFHPVRKFRFDFAWPPARVALECEGLGRHQRVRGYRQDCEKYSMAASLGWRVLRVMSCDMAKAKWWVEMVCEAIANAEQTE
jgi:very-short-patch-repair endonuclease